MKLRTRIALALAACFVVAGALVLAVSAVTYQRAVYDSPAQQVDKILSRLGSNREQAIAYVLQFVDRGHEQPHFIARATSPASAWSTSPPTTATSWR